MSNPKLIILQSGQAEREVDVSSDISIGRAFDNSVRIDEPHISRYHALIEVRGGEYWLSDLGSAGGTAVNDERVVGERLLRDGDLIVIGGASRIRFFDGGASARSTDVTGETLAAPAGEPTAPLPTGILTNDGSQSGQLTARQIAIAVAAGLALILAVAAPLWLYFSKRNDCRAVSISSPESGAVINRATRISVTAARPGCIKSLSFRLGDQAIASVERPPFDATLDPAELKARFPALASGRHELSVFVEDARGNRSLADSIELRLEVASTAGGPTWVEARNWAQSLAARIADASESQFIFEREFAEKILEQARREEFRFDFSKEAGAYSGEINRAFYEAGLSRLLGYVMAFGQSGFKQDGAPWPCQADRAGIGLWRVPRPVALDKLSRDHLAADELERELRSARVAAAYLKTLWGTFDHEDFIYAIACYGDQPGAAGDLRVRLEQHDRVARRNFWKMRELNVVTEEMAGRVICFFAAGVVGEHPRDFGINADPISSLF